MSSFFPFSPRPLILTQTVAALLTTHLAILAAEPTSKPNPTDTSTPTELPTVVVTAEPPGYLRSEATTAARIDVPIKDLPLSVQVVPAELLQDRGVTRLDQALENVSGVQAESSYGGNGATFFNIRGFTTSNGLRDGFRNYGYDAFRDIQNIDRIEVLKGPSGALYGGVGSLGGYVNTVSKRPFEARFGQLDLTVGSFGLVRPTLDFNLPAGPLAFRLNAAYEHNDTFRDRGGYDSFSVAPAIKWNLDENTTLTLLTEYGRLKREAFDFGVPNVPQYSSLSRRDYFGLPHDYGTNDTYSGTLIFEHKLNDDWTWRTAAHYTYASQLSNQTFPDLYLYTSGDALPFTTYVRADEDSTDWAVQSELIGKFNTGPIKHHFLFGAEYGYLAQGSGPSTRYSFNLSLSHPGRTSDYTFAGIGSGGRASSDSLGLYVQDLVELLPQVKLLLGARQDWFFNEARAVTGELQAEAEEHPFSARTGIVWQPVTATSLYFSWGKAYAPNIGHGTSISTYDAEVGKQLEIGVKQDLIKDRLTATLAAYHLTRENILVSDPANPENLLQTGERRSRGIEFDLVGQITPGWKVIASYAYTDAEVTSDTIFPEGDKLSNVPRNSGSLWSTYQFQDGTFKGLGFGGGLYYVGEREANLPNAYKLPGYWRTDATVFYERGNWRAQANFLNLLDRHYYSGGEAGVFNYMLNPSQPLSVQATLSYKF